LVKVHFGKTCSEKIVAPSPGHLFSGALQAFYAGVVGFFDVFLQARSQGPVPRIEPLTVQSLD